MNCMLPSWLSPRRVFIGLHIVMMPEFANLLVVLLIFLAATAGCAILFNRLGLGSVVGIIEKMD